MNASEQTASAPAQGPDTPLPTYIGPNWLVNGPLAAACLATSWAVYSLDINIPSNGLLALFLAIGSLAFLAAHIPGASGIWINEEGFEMRETFLVTRVKWDDIVIRFRVRRRLMGAAAMFNAVAEGRGRYEKHILPRGVGRSVRHNCAIMNAWLDRYGPAFDFPDEDGNAGNARELPPTTGQG